MNKQIFLKWFKINILFFAATFIAALALAFLFPDAMLEFVRKWGAYSIAVGPTALESASIEALFVNILAKNGFMTILYFIASLFFLAPLIAMMCGVFYSLGLVSAFERGLVPFWHSPILIAIEVSFILLTITFASAFASEIFGVNPNRKDLIKYWKKNLTSLFPKQEKNWKLVVKENKKEFILFIVIILALLLFGAWFEVLY